jgi:hypothetical protein
MFNTEQPKSKQHDVVAVVIENIGGLLTIFFVEVRPTTNPGKISDFVACLLAPVPARRSVCDRVATP